jgi:hypothetical protein
VWGIFLCSTWYTGIINFPAFAGKGDHMSDTGDRHDNFPENKTEFSKFNKEHSGNTSKFGGDWKNQVTQGIRRSVVAVRNRKIFPRAK